MYNEFVTSDADQSAAEPVFTNCVRCGYSLRGLPANHFCPECGLRFDERCVLFRATNTKRFVAFWILVFSGGWTYVRYVPRLFNLSNQSSLDKFTAILSMFLLLFMVWLAVFMVKQFRRGFVVAITTDGLMVLIPGYMTDLIPWSDIGGASVLHRREGKPQVASLHLKSKKMYVDIGGMANVFPMRADVELFVRLVNERVESQGKSSVSAGDVK